MGAAGHKEGVLKLLTTQMHSLELNVSLTSLWLTEFNQRNNASLTDLKKKLAKARDEAAALGAQLHAMEADNAARKAAMREMQAELHAVDAQFSLLVSTIEKQNLLYARDLDRLRADARFELLCAACVTAGLVAMVMVCNSRRARGAELDEQRQRLPSGLGAGVPRDTSDPFLFANGSPRPMVGASAAGRVWRNLAGVARGRASSQRPLPWSHSLDTLRDVADGAGEARAGAAPSSALGQGRFAVNGQPLLPQASTPGTSLDDAHGGGGAFSGEQPEGIRPGGPDGIAAFTLDDTQGKDFLLP
jgi:hypothetical protein